jgi:hypothetical protein
VIEATASPVAVLFPSLSFAIHSRIGRNEAASARAA